MVGVQTDFRDRKKEGCVLLSTTLMLSYPGSLL
jgi:hypothetical protein